MSARLLAVLLVLGLLPTVQLVASIADADSLDTCTAGEKGDICPSHCCPKPAHVCRCHDNPCITRTEPAVDVSLRIVSSPARLAAERCGRRMEPPPVRPPIA